SVGTIMLSSYSSVELGKPGRVQGLTEAHRGSQHSLAQMRDLRTRPSLANVRLVPCRDHCGLVSVLNCPERAHDLIEPDRFGRNVNPADTAVILERVLQAPEFAAVADDFGD